MMIFKVFISLLPFIAFVFAKIHAKELENSCVVAPNCAARNREECVHPATTCGPCLEGFVSTKAELAESGNIPCVASSELEEGSDSDAVTEVADLPIIDLGTFFDSTTQLTQEQEKEFMESVKKLCLGPGFAYLKNHGLDADLLGKTMDDLKAFFELPLDVKQASGAWNDPLENSGYVRVGGEGLDEDNVEAGDPKESYDMNKKHMLAHPYWKNSTVVEYWAAINEVKEKALILLTKAMKLWLPGGDGLPDNFLTERHKGEWNTLRLLNYVPVADEKVYRCGPHTDYGTITLVFQDEVGGLEVFNRVLGKWQEVEYKEGTIVLNLADLLNRWTNGIFLSTVHRVVSSRKSKDSCATSRNSIVYFVNPDQLTVIDPKSIFGENAEAKYPAITSKDYLVQRLTATFNVDSENA